MASRNKEPQHLKLGRQGEEQAVQYLIQHGYTVCARNWCGTCGEIDIVCEQGELCIFTEVKTRNEKPMNVPHHALTPHKQKNLVQTASQYLTEHEQWHRPCRFDFIAVSIDSSQHIHIHHSPDVFQAQDMPWQPW